MIPGLPRLTMVHPIHRQIIRVAYPTGNGRIVLRTEQDWENDVEARSVEREGCVSEFLVETTRPYFYFKPILLRDGIAQWSRGENLLAVTTSGAPLEVYPYFSEDTHCSVCELMPPLRSEAGVERRFRVFLPPGYRENTLKKYPVLYRHDGQNLFFKEEAFLGNAWKADEVLDVLDRMNASKKRSWLEFTLTNACVNTPSPVTRSTDASWSRRSSR